MRDGSIKLDETGVELSSMTEVRQAAVLRASELLRDGANEDLWSGKPWFLWVTEDPKAEGKVLLKLMVGEVTASTSRSAELAYRADSAVMRAVEVRAQSRRLRGRTGALDPASRVTAGKKADQEDR